MAKTFTGALAIPSALHRLSVLLDEDERQALLAQYAEETISKLRLLCQHYGIPEGPDKYLHLSLALARDFVPAFQERNPRGRQAKWTALSRGALVVEIERCIANAGEPRRSVHWAAEQLAQREPWQSCITSLQTGRTRSNPAEALRRQYFKSKDDKWAAVMRDAFRLSESQGTLAEWDALVDDIVRNPRPQ